MKLPTSLNLILMPRSEEARVPTCRVETWVGNKTAHPGLADRVKMRRSKEEVQKLHMDKAQAKVAHEEAKQKSIQRMAEFELQDMVDEDFTNATPHPPFTPRHLPQPQNPAYSGLTPIAVTSKAEMASDLNKALFTLPTDDDLSDEDDVANDVTEDNKI
jgi:hypothetical protein